MNNAEVLIKFKGETKEADNAIKTQKSNLESLEKTGELAFAGLTAAADAFAGAILNSGINYNAQIETYLTRLETLTGSAEQANNVLEQIKKDALATPFEVSSLTSAESLLLATGMSAEQARADILALGDAISASGGGNEELSRMAVNLQQIKNVGKASALDIKQFAYAGIDIYGLLADSMGVTREEASEMDVTYEILSKSLQKASKQGGKYYKAMEKQSKTYNGAMSNLKESVQVFTGAMSEDLFDALKGIIVPLTDFFDWMVKNKDIIIEIAKPLLIFINVFAGFLAVQKATTILKGLFAVMSAHPIGLVVAAIAGIITIFIELWNNCEDFRNFWIGLWDGIKDIISEAVNFIKDLFSGLWDGIKTGAKLGYDYLIKPFVDVGIWFNNKVIKPIINFFEDLWKGIKNGVSGAWDKIVEVFGDMATWVYNHTVGPIINYFDDLGRKIKEVLGLGSEADKAAKKYASGGSGYSSRGGGSSTKGSGGGGGFRGYAVGTNYVPSDMITQIHKGEAIIPKKFNPYANGMKSSLFGSMQVSSIKPIINVYNNMEIDPLGQVVSNIKTFSGGSKNDYNYGAGV